MTERNSNRPNIKVYNIEDMDLDLTWPAHFWRPPVPLSPFFKMAEKVGILDLISNFKIWTSQFNKFHLDWRISSNQMDSSVHRPLSIKSSCLVLMQMKRVLQQHFNVGYIFRFSSNLESWTLCLTSSGSWTGADCNLVVIQHIGYPPQVNVYGVLDKDKGRDI